MAFWTLFFKLPWSKIASATSDISELIGAFKPKKAAQNDTEPKPQFDSQQLSPIISRIEILEENMSIIHDQITKHNKGIEELIVQIVSLANSTQRLSKRVTLLFILAIVLFGMLLFLIVKTIMW